MEEIVRAVAQKTGISETQARTAVETVVNFIKNKLPAPVAGQIDNAIGGKEQSVSGGMAAKIGGLLGQ